MSARKGNAARSSVRMLESAPAKRPNGVRMASQIKACLVMSASFLLSQGCRNA
jgi:hypothetical protein